ncbi:MAG TPA: HAMP domain-containing sensor histidine kinase [Ktedonobacterales bacterium]|nr:HAMP domain-containing sensor histidine kinase [Ktedonobacterales bacterium]
MIAHAYPSWPGAENGNPEMGSPIDNNARQMLNDLLAIQMRLELATGIPVAIYGNTGQTLPGISPARPRLTGSLLPAPKDLVPPQDWPRQRGQIIKITHKACLHFFITPLMLGNRPAAQVILGPLQIFEPGAQRESASSYSVSGKSSGALGIPILPSWRAQAVAELAGTIVSTLSMSLSAPIPLTPEQHGPLVSDQPTVMMPGIGQRSRGSGEFPARLGSLAEDAGLSVRSGASGSLGYAEMGTTASGPLPNRLPSYPGSGPFYPPSRTGPLLHYPGSAAVQLLVDNGQELRLSSENTEERGIAPLQPQGLQPTSREMKLAELQQTADTWLPALFEGMPQAIIVCAAPDGQIVLANQAARALWPDLLAEAPVADVATSAIITTDVYPPEWAGLSLALHQDTSLFRSEVSIEIAGNKPATLPAQNTERRLPSQEGAARQASRRSLLVSAFPLRTAQGIISHAVAIFEDLGSLVEREQFKDEFLLTAAHDMRNPLTVISSYTQLLERHLTLDATSPDHAVERARGRLHEIQQQVQLLTDLSEQMHTITQLQSANQRPQRETINLARLAQRLVVDQRLLTPGRAFEITVEDDPCLVQADPAHLQHIIMNLLKNAVQYSHPNKPILLSLRATPENNPLWAEVSIRDQGIGIPRTSIPHIFERFYRVEDNEHRARMAGLPRPKDETVSLGLGLYLCKQLIEHMGGRIWLDSVEGLGTTVTFTVPLK